VAVLSLVGASFVACTSTTIINYYGPSDGGATRDAGSGLGLLRDGALVVCSDILDNTGVPLAAYPFDVCCNGVPTSAPCVGNPPPKQTTCVSCVSTMAGVPDTGPGQLCKRGSTCHYYPAAGTDAAWSPVNQNLEGTCYQACVNAGFGDCSCDFRTGDCFCFP
jgi:hypothetical protein